MIRRSTAHGRGLAAAAIGGHPMPTCSMTSGPRRRSARHRLACRRTLTTSYEPHARRRDLPSAPRIRRRADIVRRPAEPIPFCNRQGHIVVSSLSVTPEREKVTTLVPYAQIRP